MAKTLSIEDSIRKQFGEGVLKDAHSIINRENIVIPVSPKLDLILGGGIPEGSFVIFTGQPKWGKFSHLDSIIFTPRGPMRFGDIKVGDLVCTPFNDYSVVQDIFPQGLQDVYKVTFNNGDSYECGLEHLWEVRDRYLQTKVLTTQEIIDRKLFFESEHRPKWSVIPSICRFDYQKVDIDPYILGQLLRNGGLTTTNRQPNKIRDALNKYGLMGKNSHNKFIPSVFKYNTTAIRYKVLQGIFDTDGCMNKNGTLEYTSTSKTMIEDVKEIVLSLGGLTRIKTRTTYCNNKAFQSYRCLVQFKDKSKLFKLSRKKNICSVRSKPLLRKIINIDYVGKKECQCIKIDHPRGLYVGDNYIATHNTTIALNFAATCQQPQYGGVFYPQGRHIYYYNIEGRLKPRDLKGIPNLDFDKFHLIESEPGKVLTGEEFLQIADTLINSKPGSVHILDSYSALCTESELTSGMDQMQRADGAKLLAKFCRKIANVVPINQNIVIGITHLIGNPTGYGKAFKEKSGQAIAYQVDVKLQAVAMRPWTDKNEVQIGQETDWQCITSSIGPPGKKTTSYMRYGEGIDKVQELAILGCDLGFISKGGSWYSFDFLDEPIKAQGLEKVRQELVDHPDWQKQLKNKIEMFI